MLGTLNTLQLYCGKTSLDTPEYAALEDKGYAIESVPANSNKHVFHFTGRCNRSIGSIITADANPFDIFALLAESELGNPFTVWEPGKVQAIVKELAPLDREWHKTRSLGDPVKREKLERLRAELNLQRKPIIFYGSDEKWSPFMDAMENLEKSGTLREGFRKKTIRCYTPQDILKVLHERVPRNLEGKSTADYRFHTYEPGAKPIIEIFAENDPRVRPRISIAFFGSASSLREDHLRTATQSVKMCHRHGWGIVNGGGINGVMRRQIDEAKALGVYLHGISASEERGAVGISGSEKDPKVIKGLMPRYTDCKDMIHRIEHYLEHSDGICTLDGGIGTAQEIFMLLELFRQNHKVTKYQDRNGIWHDKPFTILDENGTWSPMLKWAEEKYGRENLKPLHVVHSMDEAEKIFTAQFEKYPPKLPGEVIDRIVSSADADLRLQIPELAILPAKAAVGRSPAIKNWQSIMATVDLTHLKEDAKASDMTELCKKARLQHARAVCIRVNHIAQVRKALGEASNIKIVTVTNFPAGDLAVEKAVKEMQVARAKGADEIDTVLPRELIHQSKFGECHRYLKRVIGSVDVPVKVILETAELTPEQIAQASLIARSAGAAFVKTSTGFSAKGGADIEAVEIMRRSVGDSIGVKASGGIRDFEQAMAMIDSGANVLGTSGLSITSEQQRVPAEQMHAPYQENLTGYAMRTTNGANQPHARRY